MVFHFKGKVLWIYMSEKANVTFGGPVTVKMPISLFLYPDIMRNLILQDDFNGPKDLVITRFH